MNIARKPVSRSCDSQPANKIIMKMFLILIIFNIISGGCGGVGDDD